MPLVPVAASSTSGATTTSATISTLSDSSTASSNATSNGSASSTVLLSSVSGSYSSEQQRQVTAAALGLQPYSAPAADAVTITSSNSNSSSVDLTSLDVAGNSFSSEQQRQQVAGLLVRLRTPSKLQMGGQSPDFQAPGWGFRVGVQGRGHGHCNEVCAMSASSSGRRWQPCATAGRLLSPWLLHGRLDSEQWAALGQHHMIAQHLCPQRTAPSTSCILTKPS